MKKAHLEILVGLLVIVLLVVATLAFVQSGGEGEEGWGGADGGAADMIDQTGYVPWFDSIWAPPSGEIESLFFCIQAALGAVIIGYFFGYWNASAKAKRGKQEED
ncbi:MAG TPA: energy-coupling factor ABC transporter substrate-binding protein [Methanocorpusculum sp.]|nr:energy-coupling factor ABC transporter substrate-binding protein [Methanocorpusculum sp.]